MYYLVYLTERCNLACSYCENPAIKAARLQEASYSLAALTHFLNQDPDLRLWLFGGEPLLRIDLITELLQCTRPKHVLLQTNGLLLDRIPESTLHGIDAVAISLDGPPEVTDRYRGAGTYSKAIAQAQALRARGYRGRVDARLTINPGMSIARSVQHFLHDAEFHFDAIHWQLNALFHAEPWGQAKKSIRRWFQEVYNPEIRALVQQWASSVVTTRKVRQIVPFARLMHSLLTHETVSQVRCGAGSQMWAIATDGAVYPCPALRIDPHYKVGDLQALTPAQLGRHDTLREPCKSCDVVGLCGGRCLYANRRNEWDAEGFALVCDSVKALLAALREVESAVRDTVTRGQVPLEAFAEVADYEVIP